MYSELITAIDQSDVVKAQTLFRSLLEKARDPWSVHKALFEVSLRVLNPPFINPHLPKMYGIDRELASYLKKPELELLVQLEIREFAQRNKLKPLVKPENLPNKSDFKTIEENIAQKKVLSTALAMYGYLQANGTAQLAKKLLLLGSNFLNSSLGHSVSCTAFILLEMDHRQDDDPWPTLALLAEYFCKGNFKTTPALQYSAISDYQEVYIDHLQQAVSGTGIVALHHTITLYAIERCRHLFSHQEYDHMLTMWTEMMGKKQTALYAEKEFDPEPLPAYGTFYSIFSRHAPQPLLGMVLGSLGSKENRLKLSRYLTLGVLQSYDGSYNPHYLTGLGSGIWLLENFSDHPGIVVNGLLQYLDFFFTGIS